MVFGTEGRGGECPGLPPPPLGLPSPSPACAAGSPPLVSLPAEETSFVRGSTNLALRRTASWGLLFGTSFLALGLGSRAAPRLLAFPRHACLPGSPRGPEPGPHCGSSQQLVSQQTFARGPEITMTQGDKGVVRHLRPDHSEPPRTAQQALPELHTHRD